MRMEEKRAGIIRMIEDRDIPLEDDTEVVDPEQMKNKMKDEKMEVKCMLGSFGPMSARHMKRRHVRHEN